MKEMTKKEIAESVDRTKRLMAETIGDFVDTSITKYRTADNDLLKRKFSLDELLICVLFALIIGFGAGFLPHWLIHTWL